LEDYKKEVAGDKKRKIELVYPNYDDEFNNIFAEVDKERLTQVISNLLSNAIKFTQEEGEITISVERDKFSHLIIINVRDNGYGIDPEMLPRLFTKFASKSFVGTGLGLYISPKVL
jgi:two-component system, OmpR family, sensor histidine kinase VicK